MWGLTYVFGKCQCQTFRITYATPYSLSFTKWCWRVEKWFNTGNITPLVVGEPVHWCTQLVVVRKKDGMPRLTLDFQELNRISSKKLTICLDSLMWYAKQCLMRKMIIARSSWTKKVPFWELLSLFMDTIDFSVHGKGWNCPVMLTPSGLIRSLWMLIIRWKS